MTGVLRGFDPFMNIVLDEAVEAVSSNEKNVGIVLSLRHGLFWVTRNLSKQ